MRYQSLKSPFFKRPEARRITPKIVTRLNPDEVLVFGSNLAGRHGMGLAKEALKYGARYGVGVGFCGQTYALPTKDRDIKTLPISEIKQYVDQLFEFIDQHKDYHFLVTKVGCGLAGYSTDQIKPLFSDFSRLENCSLPKEFL